MASKRGIPLVALLSLAIAACSSGGGGTPSTSSSSSRSANAGFGGPVASAAASAAAPIVVDRVFFRTPSKNIICDLGPSEVRCDMIRKSWSPPPKPSSCELDWGFGMHITGGKAGFTCAGDSLIGETEAETLEYGHAYRSGSVRCTSESTGLTCLDEKSGRGFTLAVSRYSLF
ncbi:hypothetical protein ODJ79_08320 [Actinoplanes sp. KI2]|uniref:DUF6636 domain-containing protein n=1 Tax=Actinoplanes sp. KI2 TaxID=2983315 RepID=UPI0021D5E80A|nr:DUF6636 domain-containing protein [Actinoplanes sp. KI2]MCU7723714.1 hypothetical protein [Actinoplanes sp. KI2]